MFKLFYTDAYGDERSLYPRCIVVDYDNNIWVGTPGVGNDQEHPGYILRYDGNIFSFYIGNAIFVHYTDVNSLTIDSQNNLWYLGGYGLHYYDGVNKYNIGGHGEKYHNMDIIFADRSDIIWGISEFGLSRFDPERNSWIHYTTDNSSLLSNNLHSITADHNNTKWIGTDAGVSSFDGETWTTFNTENSGLNDNKVNAIAVEKNNTIWFGTESQARKSGNLPPNT